MNNSLIEIAYMKGHNDDEVENVALNIQSTFAFAIFPIQNHSSINVSL